MSGSELIGGGGGVLMPPRHNISFIYNLIDTCVVLTLFFSLKGTLVEVDIFFICIYLHCQLKINIAI